MYAFGSMGSVKTKVDELVLFSFSSVMLNKGEMMTIEGLGVVDLGVGVKAGEGARHST